MISGEVAYQNEQGNIVIPAPINGGTEWGVFEILSQNKYSQITCLPTRSWRFEAARDLERHAEKEKWVRTKHPFSQRG